MYELLVYNMEKHDLVPRNKEHGIVCKEIHWNNNNIIKF